MPKDDINYKFTENGIVYDFYDVFVPAENFRQPALWTWGFGTSGQLGDNTTISKNTPVTTFAGGTTWKSVAAGSKNHSLAIKTDGTLWGFGGNNYFEGKLGINDGNFIVRSTPVTTFAGGNNWKQVAAGYYHSAAVKTDGTLWIWGRNEEYQLGNRNAENIITPITTFAGGNNWKQVSCGFSHTAAIKTDGSLWTWGTNSNGQLGINNIDFKTTPVTTFAGGNNWKQVSCGRLHTTAIKTDGTLWVWGLGTSGQLGNFANTNRNTPVTTFAGGTNWKSVSGGGSHTAAIKTDGTLWTWGSRLGNNTPDSSNTPVTTFAGGNNWKSVSCGASHVATIKTDGSLWVWGRAGSGGLGVNTDGSNDVNTPVTTFAGGNNWKSVAAGAEHTLAIKYSPDP